MFAIQAAIFFLPYKVWASLEGGLIASFGVDGKSPIMISEKAKYDDGVVQEAVIEKFVKYFQSIFHHTLGILLPMFSVSCIQNVQTYQPSLCR